MPGPVFAVLEPLRSPNRDGAMMVIHVELGRPARYSAVVSCAGMPSRGVTLGLDPRVEQVSGQIQAWIMDCSLRHRGTCTELRWSPDNPTRLIRILGDGRLQLCSDAEPRAEYVALSYSWGTGLLSKRDKDDIGRSLTTYGNLYSRMVAFSASELPHTLRDAVTLVHRLGRSYLWIDSICIIQDEYDPTDFRKESPRMHEYYGNALFTISVCSNEKATDPLFVPRTAFHYPIPYAKLGGTWLTAPGPCLAEILARSPLASRAWTLQEERLSPRILYWTPHRLYWSCAQTRQIELPPGPVSGTSTDISRILPQGFLLACNAGSLEAIHNEWQTVIESYSRRNMTKASDRFPALAGLAARYRDSIGSNNQYLAGLWASTLAQDLAWRVADGASPVTPSATTRLAPSWTWASLPVATGIVAERRIGQARDFSLVNTYAPEGGMTKVGGSGKSEQTLTPVQLGAQTLRIRITAAIQPFWNDEAVYRPWSSISHYNERLENGFPVTDLVFSFERDPGQAVFSADEATGQVVSYRARRRRMLGQLDYRVHAGRVNGRMVRVQMVQLQEDVCLLVEEVGKGVFARVGVISSVGPGNVNDAKRREIELV